MLGEEAAFESAFPLRRDRDFDDWRHRLGNLSSSKLLIRDADVTAQDGRRMKDLQVVCSPISVRSVRENVSTITERLVLVAEVDEVHVGFCVSRRGPSNSDPLFIEVVGVAPEAQRRGAALAMLAAVAERAPRRDIALATQDSNVAARALSERFAKSIGANLGRVPLGTYRDRDLGIRRGNGYRAWVIQRPRVEPSTK